MAKRCVICLESDAVLCVKGTSECYCDPCAKEHFGDVALLTKIEDNAKLLHQFIEGKIQQFDDVDQLSGDSTEDEDKKVSDLDGVLIDVKIKSSSKEKKSKKP